jgi:hypothetical protein
MIAAIIAAPTAAPMAAPAMVPASFEDGTWVNPGEVVFPGDVLFNDEKGVGDTLDGTVSDTGPEPVDADVMEGSDVVTVAVEKGTYEVALDGSTEAAEADEVVLDNEARASEADEAIEASETEIASRADEADERA